MLYLSGPITGMPDYVTRFADAARQLQAAGYTVVNPVDLCEAGWDWDRCMTVDLDALRTCDGVAVLDGWEASRGSRIELGEAFQRGLPVLTVAARALAAVMILVGLGRLAYVEGWLSQAWLARYGFAAVLLVLGAVLLGLTFRNRKV